MTILFLTTHLNTGGITSYLLSLSRGLINLGHKVLIASDKGDCLESFKEMGVVFFDLEFRTKSEIHPKIFLKLRKLKEFAKEHQVHVIHAQTRVSQVMGYFLSKRSGIPMVTTCHGFFKPHFFRKVFPCWGKGVIAISKPVAEHLTRDLGVSDNKICLIENGVDINKFRMASKEIKTELKQKLGISSKFVIGCIARLSSVKGLDILIRAYKEILNKNLEVYLLIAGQGPEETELKELAESLGVLDKISFENMTNQADYLLNVFDIFIMPSRQEGLGLSVMEAQATGLIVIASKVGGLVDLIEDGKTGYFVPPENHQALADKVIDVLNNLNVHDSMRQAAREFIVDRFNLENFVKRTIQFYEKNSSC